MTKANDTSSPTPQIDTTVSESGLAPLTADIRKIKWTALIGPFLYMPWYWGMQYLYPGSWNPFWPRFLLSVMMWFIAAFTILRPQNRRPSVALFEVLFMLMVIHHFVMAYYNDQLIVYRYTFFLISVMSGALMMSMRSYVILIAIVMACKAVMFSKAAITEADLKFEIFEFVLWFFQFVVLGYLVNSIFKSRREIVELGQQAADDAIAIEAARASRLEAEKKLLENDIEVAATVQSLLIPKTQHFREGEIEVGAYFQPASKAGGDWWWFSKIRENRHRLVVADVTGHGAGAAMVTALLAGCYQTICETMKDASTEEILQTLNKVIRESCGEKHWVTLMAIEFDLAQEKMEAWTMAAPEIFLARRDDPKNDYKIEVAVGESPSRPMGHGELHFEKFERPFRKGDEVFVFTDGLFEFVDTTGDQFGLRRLRNLFQRSLQAPENAHTEQSCLQKQVRDIAENVNSARRDSSLEDDMTFAIVRHSGR